MKKIIKIIRLVLIISMILIAISSTITFAGQSAIPDVGEFDPTKAKEDVPIKFSEVVGTIAGILQVIGVVISIISISILGIKYMVGSVEARAEYKKTMIPFIVGSIFIVATGTIVRIINDLTTQAIK